MVTVLSLLFGGAVVSAQTNAVASAQTKPNSSVKPAVQSDAPAATPLVQATQEFITKTEQLAQIQANEILWAELKVAEVGQLVNEGLVAKVELQKQEESLAALRAKLAATHQQVADAQQRIVDIRTADELAKTQLAAAKASAQLAARSQSFLKPTIMRYSGSSPWLMTNLPGIQSFFTAKFGRALPTSAIGQSATHNQLGYDHRNAVDVPLHPDSLEGQTLINFLRSQGIPFLAFRGAIPGVATGPHIHIGSPSHRIS
jgi:hypothetical protein